MARIGDEIDPHPLGRVIAGLVDEVDDPLAVRCLAQPHLPALIARAEPDQLDRPLAIDRSRCAQSFRRRRMPDRDPRILT